MNQDQVKERLLGLEPDVEEFFLIFSGKTSKKAHGLYYPDTREIIIHNRNFSDDNSLMYTAIHEFAHHVHFTSSPVPVGNRAHTIEFRRILHELLNRAEEKQIYYSPFTHDPEFMGLTYRIRTQFLQQNGRLMKEFGSVLAEAQELCEKRNARFDDYVERVLSLNKSVANTLMRIHQHDVSPELGYENMKTVAAIRDPEDRKAAEDALKSGQSADMVKARTRASEDETEDPLEALEKEKRRIERTIRSLESKLKTVEERLASLGDSPRSGASEGEAPTG
jgi:predicted ribosome quality control (RQC) complex YloA/Tae2 family protein